MSPGSVMRSRVMPWMVSPGASGYGVSSDRTSVIVRKSTSSVTGTGSRSVCMTRISSPRCRSIDAGPTWSAKNGSITTRPASISRRITSRVRIILLLRRI